MTLMPRLPDKDPKSIVLAVALIATLALTAWQPSARQPKPPENLSASEFSRLIREFSEEGGYFRSDNFTSNETAYLTVVDKMRQLNATGGAYLGVGPEQNFTYIAKIRPRIAFIVDIRRQAMIQHLMYKAIFQLSPNRALFLSRLLSRQLHKEDAKDESMRKSTGASAEELMAFFDGKPVGDDLTYNKNLAEIRQVIEEDFQFPLSDDDQKSLDYVYKTFRNEGLNISFRIGRSGGGYFPTLKDLIVQHDLNGKTGNFLATAEDYDFVRSLHRKNLIIPIVGDFSGKKALAAVGDYLRKNGITVTAFYTSNVEQFLFEGGSFGAFTENVRRLPINDRSLFIRAVAGRYPHPAQLPGHRLTTLLQQMTVFLKDFDNGRYQNYQDLVTTNYITGEKP